MPLELVKENGEPMTPEAPAPEAPAPQAEQPQAEAPKREVVVNARAAYIMQKLQENISQESEGRAEQLKRNLFQYAGVSPLNPKPMTPDQAINSLNNWICLQLGYQQAMLGRLIRAQVQLSMTVDDLTRENAQLKSGTAAPTADAVSGAGVEEPPCSLS